MHSEPCCRNDRYGRPDVFEDRSYTAEHASNSNHHFVLFLAYRRAFSDVHDLHNLAGGCSALDSKYATHRYTSESTSSSSLSLTRTFFVYNQDSTPDASRTAARASLIKSMERGVTIAMLFFYFQTSRYSSISKTCQLPRDAG